MKKSLLAALVVCLSFGLFAQDEDSSPIGSILGMIGDSYAWSFSLKAPKVSKDLVLEDQAVKIEIEPYQEGSMDGPINVSLVITNKSASPIVVDWANSYTTSFKGKKRPVYHNNFDDLPATQPPTTIAAKDSSEDEITPRSGVNTTFHKAHWDEDGNWVEAYTEINNFSLFFGDDFPSDSATLDKDKNLAAVRKDALGKEFKVGLSIKVAGKSVLYEAAIKVDDIVLAASENPFGDLLKQGQ